jgi:hypothetical protein
VILVLASSAAVAWQGRDVRLFPLAVLVFPAIHLGSGAGILLEFVKPERPPRPAARRIVAASTTRRAA